MALTSAPDAAPVRLSAAQEYSGRHDSDDASDESAS